MNPYCSILVNKCQLIIPNYVQRMKIKHKCIDVFSCPEDTSQYLMVIGTLFGNENHVHVSDFCSQSMLYHGLEKRETENRERAQPQVR